MYRGSPLITEEQIPDLFMRWLKGESLRKLAENLGCKHQSLHERFTKKYGNLRQHKQGLFRIIQGDYLDNPRYSKGEKEVIESWFRNLEIENLISDIDLFSEKELKNYTANYCGYSTDFRDVFTNQKVQGQML